MNKDYEHNYWKNNAYRTFLVIDIIKNIIMGKHIAIIHPDLGIGGAEQLIVNIALALKISDLNVTIFTPRHEKARSFKETHDGSLNVHVKGNVFPSSILGKGTALCSMIRMLFASLYVILFGGKYDYILVDQVSSILPIFWLSSAKIIFYCHFPDQLLCVERKGFLKSIYRYILDKIEEIGLWKADLIFVNSNFTLGITLKTFKSLKNTKIGVLYPCINLDFLQNAKSPGFMGSSPYFFSLNRYERKKNINLAILSYSLLKQKISKLLIGGGYDPQMTENIEHFKELTNLCTSLNLKWCEVSSWTNLQPGFEVYFAKNLSEQQREEALQNTISVLYTPENGKL